MGTLSWPAKGAVAVVKSDVATDRFSPSIIYAHDAGNLTAVGEDDVTFTVPMDANTWIPVRVTGVLDTGTTITNLTSFILE